MSLWVSGPGRQTNHLHNYKIYKYTKIQNNSFLARRSVAGTGLIEVTSDHFSTHSRGPDEPPPARIGTAGRPGQGPVRPNPWFGRAFTPGQRSCLTTQQKMTTNEHE